METAQISVSRRFLGPPNSANGGYVSGRVAGPIAGSAEVTLHLPPPLDKPLVLKPEGSGVALFDGETRLASAIPAALSNMPIKPVPLAQARAAARRTFPVSGHPLPECFVCGPARLEGDGLKIHVGPLQSGDPDWQGLLAADWTPHDSLDDGAGLVRPEFLWAALDCPTGYAVSSSQGMRSVLLGRQTVSISRQPAVGESLVVAAQQTGRDGRKFFADSALFDANGDNVAACRAIWIEVSPEVQRGLAG